MRTIKNPVHLDDEQRAQLKKLTTTGKASARRIRHANILLDLDACDNGPNRQKEIAQKNRAHPSTASKVARDFCQSGLEIALSGKIRETPAITPKITGEVEARIVALACSTPPQERTSWTLSLLADKAVELDIIDSICDVSVMRILKKHNSSRI
jgi:hypothetical protein